MWHIFIWIFIFGFSYATIFPDGLFVSAAKPFPTEWFHLVFNFIGPNDGEGFVVYHDVEESVANEWRQSDSFETGLGAVVLGAHDGKYSSLMMDELLFVNRKLTLNEIQILYNMAEWIKRKCLKRIKNECTVSSRVYCRLLQSVFFFLFYSRALNFSILLSLASDLSRKQSQDWMQKDRVNWTIS